VPFVTPAYGELGLSPPASSEAVEEPLPPEPAPGSYAAVEPRTEPLPPTLVQAATSGQADGPTPGAASTNPVIAAMSGAAGSEAVAAAAPLEPVPAMPLTAAPPPTMASPLTPVAPPQLPSAAATMPALVPPLEESRDREPSAPPLPSPPLPTEGAEPVTPSTNAEPIGVDPPRPPAVAEAFAASRHADAPTVARDPSPLGLGLGRLRIRLDGAAVRTTDRDTDIISGRLVGGRPERVVVQVGEQTSVPTLAGRAFATAVRLSPGVNRVRVLATDAQGGEVEQIVSVEYKPPVASNVTITSPRDGQTLGPGDPPLVTVQGDVADPGLGAVWIVANGRRVMVPVTSGRFRALIPVLEPTVRIRAETGGEDHPSATVTVDASAALPAIGLFLDDWPRETAGPAQLTVTWRSNPARLDGGARLLSLSSLPVDGETSPRFFYLPTARPGVYTFVLTHSAQGASAVRPVLSLGGASRSLKPVAFDGPGRSVVTRLLLPQGVVWEEDDWFTGRSATGDTITKFRFPEGVSWTERVGAP
jgi:hypothetical protein